MESGAFLASLDQFMLSPLVTWVKTFIPADEGIHLDFSDLLDGVILNMIMAEINPSAPPQGVNKVCKDSVQRIQNLNVLVQQIRSYYLDNLRQLIMIPLPDVLLVGRTPYCEQSLEEMKKLLLLLLGCTVQCEKKEEYIERIQMLDFDTKAAIAAHIQELTHSQENVLDLQWLESRGVHPEEMETVVRNVATHLRHVLDQRDKHLETIVELMQEKDGAVSLLSSPSSLQSASYSPSKQQPQKQQTGTQQHLAVELADSKAKIRRLRQELEEKSEQILDCRHELENMEAELKRIQQENYQLQADARAARTYRDELDALRERAIKADKLESEVGRYKEQMHKMEFYKAKVEELKEDNRVLQETKEVLEDQLEGWRSRTDKIHQLEKHNLLLKARVYDMEQEKETDVKQIKELQEENLALCLAQRRSMEESQHLGWELEQLSKTTENSHGLQTLSEEVSERTQSQILKLEKENQRLLRTIEELRATAHNTCRKTQHTHHLVRSSNHFTSSAEQSLVKTTSCSATENHPDAQTLQIPNGDSVCQQQLITEELEGVQTQILLADHPDCQMQENGHLQEQDKEMMSGLEILENNHNQLHCFVGPCSLDSPSKSPQHDNICASLPTRSPYTSKHTQRLEVKCRGLDTLNQQLQTSLYSTERKAQRLEAEVQELESENQTLQASLEELRISLRRLEQLETGKQNLEHETTMLERDKRQLEKENRRLRQQAEIQEANLDSRNVCMASLEREMRLLVKEMEGLRETSERVKSLERENRELTKQAAIDQKTLATLREELVSEKLKTQQRDNDLEKLSHELEMKVLKQESTQLEAPDSRIKILESELESSLKKSLQIKDDKMVALEAHLQESSVLTQRLWQDLKTVKLSYEAMQQQQEEEWTASSSSPPVQPNKTMTECLRESQEATRELLRLQDRLIEVERNNATLEAERQAAQVQLKQLECQSDSQQAQVLALQRQAASLQESNTALQTHNANLQVEKSTLNSQSASLMAQNAHLQQQQSGIESERDSAVQEREELRGAHEQLLRDHERLTVLHERQAMEYEALMGKHACLKNVHRTLELENRTLQDRYNNLLQQRAKLEDLEKTLKEEQMRISLEKEKHQTTAAECCRLRDEKDRLNRTYNQLLSDNEALTADHKLLKSQLNEANLKHTWLEADFSKLKKEYQELDISSTKLTNQCELLSQLKRNLEEENRHLISQIETLMLQNRTLLEQNMESKDLFHVEERQYIDKLNDLRRQKEKLEEKIMDQYRFYDPSPPRRRGNWIALKLKKLMKSSSRENEPETTHVAAAEPQLCSHDNGSFISSDGSGGSASTSAGDFISQQRSSTPLKKFPRLKNRLKDRDKVKSIFRRSLSLSSLSHPSTSFEAKQDTDVDECQEHLLTSSLSISISSILQHPYHSTTPPSGHFNNNTTDTGPRVSELRLTDKDSKGSTVPSGCDDSDRLQNHGMNVVQCGLLSESSGELSLSLENEPWSNGSSPVQQPPSCNSSSSYQPPSDTSSPQPHTNLQEHMEKASTMPTPSSLNSDIVQRQKDLGLSQDFWLTRGTKTIRKGSRTKMSRHSSDSGGADKINSELNRVSSKDETAQASACSPITVLYVQGKSSSMSGCLNCFSTRLVKEGQLGEFRCPKSLPRASSVISSAEGSSRRSSITSECRRTIQTEPAQTTEKNCTQEQTQCQRQEQNPDTRNSQPGPIPPVKPPRDPTVIVPTEHHTFTLQDPSLGSSFTFNSVFSDTIFRDSEPTTTTLFDTVDMSTNLLCPNSSAEQNAPPERKETAEKTPQALLSSENEQRGKTENAKGLYGKDRLLTGT